MREPEIDLEKRERERRDKIAAMQKFVDEGLRSGIGSASRDELFAIACERAKREISKQD